MRRLSVTCGWPVVLSRRSGFLHHLKLIFPTPSSPTLYIAPFLYRQTLSMHVKPNEIRVKLIALTAWCGNSMITEKSIGSHVIRNNLES